MPWPSNLTLEVSFGFGSGPFAASPTWTDVIADVRYLHIERGRTSTQRPFDPGTATVVLDNTGGQYDPNNSTATHAGNLTLGTPVRIRAVHDTVTYSLFFGHVSRWPLAFEMPNESTARIELTEGLAIVRRAALESEAFTQHATDDRIGAILDAVGWPAAARSLEAGVTDLVAAVTYSGDAGALIDETVDAEQGYLFMRGNRAITFYNRTHYSSAATTANFGGAGHAISDVQVSYDDDQLVNTSNVTAADEATATATDATSRSRHGPSAAGLGDIDSDTILSEPYALNVAEWMVGRYKDIVVRVVGFTVYPDRDEANMYPDVLGLDLGAYINVAFTPPAGDALDQDVRIERITHEVTPGLWRTTFGCYPLATIETNGYWILGTSALGTGTRLA